MRICSWRKWHKIALRLLKVGLDLLPFTFGLDELNERIGFSTFARRDVGLHGLANVTGLRL